MSSQKDILNKLIPADELYWCKEEKKYVAISQSELTAIILKCIDNEITDPSEIVKMTNWATNIHVGNILLKGFLKGSVPIAGFDESNEPIFGEN